MTDQTTATLVLVDEECQSQKNRVYDNSPIPEHAQRRSQHDEQQEQRPQAELEAGAGWRCGGLGFWFAHVILLVDVNLIVTRQYRRQDRALQMGCDKGCPVIASGTCAAGAAERQDVRSRGGAERNPRNKKWCGPCRVAALQSPDGRGCDAATRLLLVCARNREFRCAPLPAIRSKPVVVEPQQAQLTSDAGLLPIRQLDEQLGLTAQFAAALHDPRDPAGNHAFLPANGPHAGLRHPGRLCRPERPRRAPLRSALQAPRRPLARRPGVGQPAHLVPLRERH